MLPDGQGVLVEYFALMFRQADPVRAAMVMRVRGLDVVVLPAADGTDGEAARRLIENLEATPRTSISGTHVPRALRESA